MKNMKRGFKLASPLKQTSGPGDEKTSSTSATSTTTSRPGQLGGIEGTIVSKSTIKKNASGTQVQTVAPAQRYKKARPKGWSDAKLAAHNKKKRAEWDAQDAKAKASKASAASDSKETDESFVPKMEDAKPGDRIDNFTSEERRMQTREGKVSKRAEKEEGSQNTRRTGRYGKQEAKNMGMSNKEARQVKKDIKAGRTNANVTKALGGEENAKLARSEYEKSKWQGPVNKAGKTLSLKNPDQAAAVKGQGAKGQSSNAYSGVSTGTTYTKGSLLEEKKEGGPKKITEETKNLEVAVPSKKSVSNAEAKETTTTAKPKEEEKKYDYSKNAPFLKAGNQGPLSAPAKMKASALKFVMKGFGSKSGFSFGKKK